MSAATCVPRSSWASAYAGAMVRLAGVLRVAAVATLVAATLAGCSSAQTSEPVDWGSTADYAQELFAKSNEQRVDAGMAELVWSDCLESKALPRAQATLPQDSLTHEALVATCEPSGPAGENLTRGPYPADNVVERWMGSEGHRANILDPDFTTSGIACVAMSFADPTREAEDGEERAGYACSQLFEGSS